MLAHWLFLGEKEALGVRSSSEAFLTTRQEMGSAWREAQKGRQVGKVAPDGECRESDRVPASGQEGWELAGSGLRSRTPVDRWAM